MGDLAFKGQHKLEEKRDYQRLFQGGRKVVSKGLITLFLPNQRENARLGVSVSKAKVKRAVKRNQIKRWVREGFRLNQVALGENDFFTFIRHTEKVYALGAIDIFSHWQKVVQQCCNSG